jgi:restriction endonuclease S subunit
MKKRIKDIANLGVGYQFRGKVEPDPAGNVRVIQIKDIDADHQIGVGALESVNVDRPGPYLTHQGDVLFLGRGHRLYAVVVPEIDGNIVATGYFFILRAKANLVLPEYLAWSMNQADFQESLRPYLRGTHMPMVSRADVGGLKIPLPPLDVQRQILKLNDLVNEERRLSAAIHNKRTLLVQFLSRKLMLGQLDTKDD